MQPEALTSCGPAAGRPSNLWHSVWGHMTARMAPLPTQRSMFFEVNFEGTPFCRFLRERQKDNQRFGGPRKIRRAPYSVCVWLLGKDHVEFGGDQGGTTVPDSNNMCLCFV